MNRLVNCAILSLFVNRIYSRILDVHLLNLTHLNFSYNFNARMVGTRKNFTQSELTNKAIKNPVSEVKIVSVLSDNFSYILKDPDSSKALCVDPVEHTKVCDVAKESNWDLSLLLCTHKHWDHSGGNLKMKSQFPDMDIVGSSYEDVPGVTRPVKDEDVITFGGLEIKCLKAPCHTKGHIMYYVYSPKKPELQPILFTGDTLFIGGCGRFFEGTSKLMLEIVEKIKTLPMNTLIYCGHEYTVKNLEFAFKVDKSTPAVFEKLSWARRIVSNGGITVPSILSEEFTYNPFLRTKELMSSLDVANEEAAMATLRKMKDKF